MKIVPYVFALGALVLFLGCNRSSDTSTGGSSDNQLSASDSGKSSDSSRQSRAASQPDNTGTNVRDRSDSTLTPGDQGENKADIDLAGSIRRQVTSNDQLSSEAKNIKIIATNGKVTLRGPVKSEEERKIITAIAQRMASSGGVDDQLEVKTTTQ
ncbi:MAG TPA: BON domain-containing protein [Patescibacteria group bacterium]|jgi:osmotically-inducible protein OsmY|nr:BON domain-containing protein [Patescibacteria group bacterium]